MLEALRELDDTLVVPTADIMPTVLWAMGIRPTYRKRGRAYE